MKYKLLVSLYVFLGVICDFVSASSSDSEDQASYFESMTKESNRVKSIARSYSMSSLGKKLETSNEVVSRNKAGQKRYAMTSADEHDSANTSSKRLSEAKNHQQEQIDTSNINITVTPVVRTRKNSDVKRKLAKAQDPSSKDVQKDKKTIENPKPADKKNSEPNKNSQKVMPAKQDDTNRTTNAAASQTENNIDRRQTVNKRSSSVQRPRLKNAIDNPSLNNDNKSVKKRALTSDEEIIKRKKEESLLTLLDDEEIFESCVSVATLSSRLKNLFVPGLGVKSFFENNFCSYPSSRDPKLKLIAAEQICAWRNLLENAGLENSQSYLDTYGAVMDLIPIYYSKFDLPHLDFSELDVDNVLGAITPIINSYDKFPANDFPDPMTLGYVASQWDLLSDNLNFSSIFAPSKTKQCVKNELDHLSLRLKQYIYICAFGINYALEIKDSYDDLEQKLENRISRIIKRGSRPSKTYLAKKIRLI